MPVTMEDEAQAAPNVNPPTPTPGVRVIRSEDLMQGDREIHIRHGDLLYRLRVTSSGRLYLTK